MPMNPRSAAIMPPTREAVDASLLEARWDPVYTEGDSRSKDEVNDSVPIETYDFGHGVCNELARIAMNRSAVMQVYDSMFPGAGVLRATARRSSSSRELSRPRWIQRMLDILRGRTPR